MLLGEGSLMEANSEPSAVSGAGRCVLLGREQDAFASRLVKALEDAKFSVAPSGTVSDALSLIEKRRVSDAVIDIKLQGESAFPLIRCLREANRQARILVLTAFPSIASAVQAIKLGACDYLPLPVEPGEAVRTLLDWPNGRKLDVAESALSVSRIEWEHINRVLTESRWNISAAARRLGMHRRTLQRKLGKHPANH